MKLVIISDTHELHEKLEIPEGDILIHCGDWTNRGTTAAIEKFFKWFISHPHKYKILIAGNHELTLESPATRPEKLQYINDICKVNQGVHYLENSEVIINGVKFYGSPVTPLFCNWAFNKNRGPDIAAVWAKIPDDVDVLITHGPAYGILDRVKLSFDENRDPHQGCKDLLDRIKQLKNLKIHAFGHLHEQGGKLLTYSTKNIKYCFDLHEQINNNDIKFCNAAMCDDEYKINRKPLIVDIDNENVQTT